MKQRKDSLVFVGSLNRAVPHFSAANGRGITTFSLDESTGKLRRLAELGGMVNPTYLAVLPSRGTLYATSEVFGDVEGSVGAHAYGDPDGTLAPRGNRRSTRGSLSAHCSTDRDGRYLFVANYAHETREENPGRHVVAYAIEPDGTLSEAVSEHAHSGSGSRADRQQVPHAHCVVASPDNRFALVSDLGTDSVFSYPIDQDGRGLLPPRIEPVHLAPGSGPRHLVFHPLLDCVYVVNELDNTLCRLSYARTNGALSLLQTIGALPGDSTPSYAADLAISNDGRFLYASFRGADCIGVYALDADGAIAELRALQPSGGTMPRSFALSPSNRFLLAANQDSDNLVVWRLDETSGCLADKADDVSIGTPMCVKLIA